MQMQSKLLAVEMGVVMVVVMVEEEVAQLL